jgi:hypothetical protein
LPPIRKCLRSRVRTPTKSAGDSGLMSATCSD